MRIARIQLRVCFAGGGASKPHFHTPRGRKKEGKEEEHTSHTPVDPRGVGGFDVYNILGYIYIYIYRERERDSEWYATVMTRTPVMSATNTLK